MSNDIEYIEPTQEHVGQMVEVRDSHQEWQVRKLLCLLESKYEFRFVCEDGRFLHLTCNWKHARIARPLTYAERQAKCGLKVGDRVRFVRRFKPDENGHELKWFEDLNNFLGHVGMIEAMEGKEGGRGGGVSVSGMPYILPYFVLEKVEDRVATHNDCGKMAYVDGAPQDEFRIVLVWQEVDDVWRAVVRSGDKRFVYELSNLRVIE